MKLLAVPFLVFIFGFGYEKANAKAFDFQSQVGVVDEVRRHLSSEERRHSSRSHQSALESLYRPSWRIETSQFGCADKKAKEVIIGLPPPLGKLWRVLKEAARMCL